MRIMKVWRRVQMLYNRESLRWARLGIVVGGLEFWYLLSLLYGPVTRGERWKGKIVILGNENWQE